LLGAGRGDPAGGGDHLIGDAGGLAERADHVIDARAGLEHGMTSPATQAGAPGTWVADSNDSR